MNPDQQYTNYKAPQDNQARKLLILGGAVLVMLMVLVFVFTHGGSSPSTSNTGGAAGGKQGSVVLQYKIDDTSGFTARFNGKVTKPAKGTTYNLNPADYTLKLSGDGYKDFTSKFSLKAGQTLLINVNVQPSNPASVDVTSAAQIDYLPAGIAGAATITSTKYFYDNTWVVLTVDTPEDSGLFLVANYKGDTQSWVSIVDPTVIFDATTASRLPAEIQQYLTDLNVVGTED
jgi:hypothetical protein